MYIYVHVHVTLAITNTVFGHCINHTCTYMIVHNYMYIIIIIVTINYMYSVHKSNDEKMFQITVMTKNIHVHLFNSISI